MEQATLHALPPDVLDEPEITELPPGMAQEAPTDPPTTPTVPPQH